MQFAYRKIRHPASGYAVVGTAVAIGFAGNLVSQAAIGITGATARAFAARDAAACLIGKPLSHRNIEHAAAMASEQAECLSDHYAPAEYRRHLVKTEVGRALSSMTVQTG